MDKNTITIEWHSIFKDVLRNIWGVVLAALIGLMGIFIASHSVYKPEYTSSAMLVVNMGSGSGSGTYTNFTVSGEVANVLSNIFVDSTMKTKAAAYAGKDKFNGNVSASVVSSTNFIEVKVSSDDPQNSYELLSAILEVYPEISENIFENAKISVLRMPSMPQKPSNSISYENQGLVVMGCMTVALFAVVALSVARDTVKNEDSFENKVDAKLVGVVSHEKKQQSLKDKFRKKKKGLLVGSNAFISLHFTESFNKIAAKLEYAQIKKGSKVFAVSSVSENEGKSTCAANIAVSLANRGHRVVLVDFDGKKPALYKIFGQKYSENSELGNLLNETIKFEDFKLKKSKKVPIFLAVNTKKYADYHTWFENGVAQKFIDALKSNADFVIIDTPPFSADAAVTNVMGFADETLLVVRTDCVATPIVNDAISVINTVSKSFMGCILNDVYPKYTPFFFSGDDQSVQYGTYGKYGKYGKYGRYGKYSKYGNYSNYSNYNDF